MSKNGQEMITLDAKLMGDIEIPRLSETATGYQRKLDTARLPKIAAAAMKGVFIPPVVLCRTEGGRLICVDGQHRLEARKLSDFPLQAIIYTGTFNQAVRDFIEMNTKNVRVGLAHRLRVDPSEFTKKIRSVASSHKVDNAAVFSMVAATLGYNNIYGNRTAAPAMIDPDVWTRVEKILSIWTKDKRWGAKGHIYSMAGILKVVAKITRKIRHERLAETIEKIKKIDFSNDSTIAQYCGLSFRAQANMEKIIIKHLMATL